MADVFVSYKREDGGVAEEVAHVLRSRGLSVFFDVDIPVGDSWDQFIERELSIARCVVVLWSRSSVASRWVRLEARDALQRAVLVPALIDDCAIPLEFQDIQSADLRGVLRQSPDLDRLLKRVASVCGANDSERPGQLNRTPDSDFRGDALVNALNAACRLCDQVTQYCSVPWSDESMVEIPSAVSQLKSAFGRVEGIYSTRYDDTDLLDIAREAIWAAAESLAIDNGKVSTGALTEGKRLLDEASYEISVLIGIEVGARDS